MLMTRDNAAEILTKELSNYKRYSRLIRNCEENIKKYENDAMNIRSPRTDRVGENTSALEFDLLKVLNQLDLEKRKIEAYSEMQSWILEVVNNIDNKSLRPDIIRVFLRGEERKVVAAERGIRYKLLNDQIKRALSKSLKPKQVDRYNQIRKKIASVN